MRISGANHLQIALEPSVDNLSHGEIEVVAIVICIVTEFSQEGIACHDRCGCSVNAWNGRPDTVKLVFP